MVNAEMHRGNCVNVFDYVFTSFHSFFFSHENVCQSEWAAINSSMSKDLVQCFRVNLMVLANDTIATNSLNLLSSIKIIAVAVTSVSHHLNHVVGAAAATVTPFKRIGRPPPDGHERVS